MGLEYSRLKSVYPRPARRCFLRENAFFQNDFQFIVRIDILDISALGIEMKILPSLLILPIYISAQTEHYISTALRPVFNNCNAIKYSFPVHYSITSEIRINSYVWNPDSFE